MQGAPDTLFDQLRAAGRADCLVWYEDGQVYRVYIGREARVYELEGMDSVSYTHLDVYKRQIL